LKQSGVIWLVIWTSISCFSCGEDQIPEIENKVFFRLDSVVRPGSNYAGEHYIYDKNNRLVQEIEKRNDDSIVYDYQWSSNGRLSGVTIVIDSRVSKFVFKKEGRYWVQERFNNEVYEYFWKYTDNRVGVDTVWTANRSGTTSRRILKYWSNGNLDSITYSLMGQDSLYYEEFGSKSFEYTDLPNPYGNLPLEWKYLGTSIVWENNAKNAYQIFNDNELHKSLSFKYSLNKDGLISKKTWIDDRGEEIIEELFYYSVLK
jgi:hypothetical protein